MVVDPRAQIDHRSMMLPSTFPVIGAHKKKRKIKQTVRVSLDLFEPTRRKCPEFDVGAFVADKLDEDPETLENEELAKLSLIAKKFEEKYGPKRDRKGRKIKFGKAEDFMDLGMGYDKSDPFIDDSEAYDELVPSTLTTQFGGFYINSGRLEFREASDESDGGVEEENDAELRKATKKRCQEEKAETTLSVPNEVRDSPSTSNYTASNASSSKQLNGAQMSVKAAAKIKKKSLIPKRRSCFFKNKRSWNAKEGANNKAKPLHIEEVVQSVVASSGEEAKDSTIDDTINRIVIKTCPNDLLEFDEQKLDISLLANLCCSDSEGEVKKEKEPEVQNKLTTTSNVVAEEGPRSSVVAASSGSATGTSKNSMIGQPPTLATSTRVQKTFEIPSDITALNITVHQLVGATGEKVSTWTPAAQDLLLRIDALCDGKGLNKFQRAAVFSDLQNRVMVSRADLVNHVRKMKERNAAAPVSMIVEKHRPQEADCIAAAAAATTATTEIRADLLIANSKKLQELFCKIKEEIKKLMPTMEQEYSKVVAETAKRKLELYRLYASAAGGDKVKQKNIYAPRKKELKKLLNSYLSSESQPHSRQGVVINEATASSSSNDNPIPLLKSSAGSSFGSESKVAADAPSQIHLSSPAQTVTASQTICSQQSLGHAHSLVTAGCAANTIPVKSKPSSATSLTPKEANHGSIAASVLVNMGPSSAVPSQCGSRITPSNAASRSTCSVIHFSQQEVCSESAKLEKQRRVSTHATMNQPQPQQQISPPAIDRSDSSLQLQQKILACSKDQPSVELQDYFELISSAGARPTGTSVRWVASSEHSKTLPMICLSPNSSPSSATSSANLTMNIGDSKTQSQQQMQQHIPSMAALSQPTSCFAKTAGRSQSQLHPRHDSTKLAYSSYTKSPNGQSLSHGVQNVSSSKVNTRPENMLSAFGTKGDAQHFSHCPAVSSTSLSGLSSPSPAVASSSLQGVSNLVKMPVPTCSGFLPQQQRCWYFGRPNTAAAYVSEQMWAAKIMRSVQNQSGTEHASLKVPQSKASMGKPQSCDTFVVLPPLTKDGFIIFGKNSDRPANEVQEVVFCPAKDHPPSSKVLPSWMWGAEMGANEHGVVIGNEAVWTKCNSEDDNTERLLGMDLLRLALERSKTAREALAVIDELLTKYGQGGPCSDEILITYHNNGRRNISNCLSISNHIDMMSKDLAESKKGASFDFCAEFADKLAFEEPRFIVGQKLLEQYTADGLFDVKRMIQILRDKPSGICRSNGEFMTTASQVSILPHDPSIPAVHFFTATPDPCMSGFKPFVFVDGKSVPSPYTVSPVFLESQDPAKVRPRFAFKVDRRHSLYKRHQTVLANASLKDKVTKGLLTLENEAIDDIAELLSSGKQIPDAENLFFDAVEAEVQLYKSLH
ncbi:unnamed protein product [Soboliphyme baturini]|uniref:HUN domain-containing protein n=1 Tax=Soboliphyme baturini TaxID=241478 RepID=A0A183IB75_9BILA|nr:unnamed protein product [Soboliphyme baturini]